MMLANRFIIFVFSFNRGTFLENCIESIERAVGSIEVCIVDDNSDDVETVSVLNRLSARYLVIRNNRSDEYEIKTGGLAGCMNLAMAHAENRDFEFAIFIQDDMQFVRPIGENDLSSLVQYFDSVQNSIQISTTFVRRLSADKFLDDHWISSRAGAYIRKKTSERGKSNFSDTGVFSVERFKEVFKRFEIGEDNNSAKAMALNLTCGRSINPFICWLPYPLSYRGKKRGLQHRIFEHFGRSGYYPIEFMSARDGANFISRDAEILPVMEVFLISPDSPRQDIWSTGGGEYNFVAYGGILAKVFSFARSQKAVIRGHLRK